MTNSISMQMASSRHLWPFGVFLPLTSLVAGPWRFSYRKKRHCFRDCLWQTNYFSRTYRV